MVDAQAVQDCSVQVAHVDGVGGDGIAEFVGFSVCRAALDTSAGKPHCEAFGVVVATVVLS